jgi:ubiquitin-conjugating enzyme E2 J1
MVAIRSFMDTDAKGQLGGIECTPQARKKMAAESGAYTCAMCGKSNADIIRERGEAAALQETRDGKQKEETVPEELRLAYRDELENAESSRAEKAPEPKGKEKVGASPAAPPPSAPVRSPPPVAPAPPPTRTVQATNPQAVRRTESSLGWIDACIYGVLAALLFMLLRKVI